MKKSKVHLSILLAGLLAVAGAQAQSTPAAGSSDGPPKAGEASNQTRGMPNAATTNSPVTEALTPSKDTLRQEAQGMGAAAAGRAGEASTMVQGRPNADPGDAMHARSRDEVRNELLTRRQMHEDARKMGNMGYAPTVGAPATLPAGSPTVFQGGTPQ